ncbi:MAG TPA: DUF523 and DUF1722 domain-containing protein [bacterium]|nr:DUF523 and DUF1722 domain-containing protein [bacterium]
MQQAKPNIVVSKCFFEPVRYNGARISNSLVDRLKEYANLSTVCPEVEIGLGAPRIPVRLLQDGDSLRMVQLKTEIDLTEKMLDFGENFLSQLENIDGFILKSKSPSCGISGVKVYSSTEKKPPVRRDKGLFGGMVKERFPLVPLENESRIMDPDIRDCFLRSVFALAELRESKESIKTAGQLVEFHTKYKLTFMAFSQKHMTVLGKIVANHERLPLPEVMQKYQDCFREAFSRRATRKTHINVLLHIFGYFSSEISGEEKKRFLSLLDRYRNGDIPFALVSEVARVYISRTDKKYLREQVYFNPYPEEFHYKT